MKNDKKAKQLGMNPSTATHRLYKDILFDLLCKTNQNICFHCNQVMSRETFSVEHKIPWLDSEKPKENFFDLTNIAFSHLHCNCKAARKPNKTYFTKEARQQQNNLLNKKHWVSLGVEEQQKRRREKYLKYGC